MQNLATAFVVVTVIGLLAAGIILAVLIAIEKPFPVIPLLIFFSLFCYACHLSAKD